MGRQGSATNRIDADPDVVLIGDFNLGFRDDEELWPQALREIAANTSIVLRTCAPLAASRLWQHLFAAWAGPTTGSLLYAAALLGAYWLVALALARGSVSLRL